MKRRYAVEVDPSYPNVAPKWDWLKKFSDGADVPFPDLHQLKAGYFWFELDLDTVGDDVGGSITVATTDSGGGAAKGSIYVTCYTTDPPYRAEVRIPVVFVGRG